MIRGQPEFLAASMNRLKHAGLKYPSAERRRRQHKIVSASGQKESSKIRAKEILTTLRPSIKSYEDYQRDRKYFDNSYCKNYICVMRSLESYRGKDFIGVEELASVAASLVERYRGEPERGNVRLMITQRIVRHYLAEDLLGDPSGQSGTSTVFHYGNLLRLLAVKKLLTDNWSVVKIREFMAALDITALEQLINSAFSRSANSQQQRKQESMSARVSSPNARAAGRRTTEGEQPRAPHVPAIPAAQTSNASSCLARDRICSAR